MGNKQLLLAVLFASTVPTGLAQAQSGPDRDELRATMRVMAPESSDPEPIFRKIPPPKSKKPGVDDDAPAKDLARPGGSGGSDDSGSAGDPVGPLDPGTVADPGVPVDPPIPSEPIIPAAPDPRDVPGDFGHGVADDARNHGEDARRHDDPKHGHDDKPPRGPSSKPPEHKPPEHKPPEHKPPDQRPPDRKPPGQQPRDPPHGPPDKPRRPRE
jgi:hypothetical protein